MEAQMSNGRLKKKRCRHLPKPVTRLSQIMVLEQLSDQQVSNGLVILKETIVKVIYGEAQGYHSELFTIMTGWSQEETRLIHFQQNQVTGVLVERS